MKSVYRLIAYLVAAGVALQASSIALGFFKIVHEIDQGVVITSDYDPGSNLGLALHGIGGTMVIPLLALIFLIVSFFTRAPGAVRWAATVLGLVILQVMLAFISFGTFSVGALHGLNALLVFGSAIWAGRRVTRVSDEDEAAALDSASV